MYELYLDAVSTSGKIALLKNQILVSQQELSIAGNESSLLSGKVFGFLDSLNIKVSSLENIYTLIGPGSFTGIRSICLFVNTLAYIYPHLTVTPLSFFDLYTSYPIIKQSSRRDVFVKLKKNAIIEIFQMQDLEILSQSGGVWRGSFDTSLGDFSHITLHSDYDIPTVLRSLLSKKIKFVEPLYIKKPNIS